MDRDYVGHLFIVSAPSGGGKTSLVKQLIQRVPRIVVSTSHTTRAPRPAEQDGVDYFFIDDILFHRMIEIRSFVEYARVFGHFYGTSFEQIQDRLRAGIDVVLDIDWQGATQIRAAFPDAVSVFIMPPSLAILEQRLLDRQQDTTTVIADRMRRAHAELSHFAEFDYLIVNDSFQQAADELVSIVVATRLCMARQSQQQRKLLSLLSASQ